MFGAPFILPTDNGREFSNKIMLNFLADVTRNEAGAWKAERFSMSRIE
jgi:hypothetical protein